MLNAKVAELLNDQINKELYSAYLYLDFAIYYEEQALKGFANWYFVQAQEERDHAMLFLKYLQNNGCKVSLGAVAKPDKELKEYADPLKAGYEHEQYDLYGFDARALYMLDSELGGRVYSAPSLVL